MYGQLITLTDTVAAVAPAVGTPTGQVTFKDGATVLGGGPVTLAGGATTLTFNGLGVGSHSLAASYPGDVNFNSTSSDVRTHTVSKASTTTSLNSATANPSSLGDPVTLSATVAVVAPGGGAIAGAVQFDDNGSPLGAPVTLIGTTATLTTSTLGGGSHTFAPYIWVVPPTTRARRRR